MTEYFFLVIERGETIEVVEEDFKDAGAAMNWAHYCMGLFYRCDCVRVYEGAYCHPDAWGEPVEIRPPEWLRHVKFTAA